MPGGVGYVQGGATMSILAPYWVVGASSDQCNLITVKGVCGDCEVLTLLFNGDLTTN